MKERIRWHLSIPVTDNPHNLGEIKKDNQGEYVLYLDYFNEVEQLQARIKELESAERTLINLGYENKGGEMWKPPIGKRPNFSLIDSLNERIKELESDAHINEIKAQGIEEAIKKADGETYIYPIGTDALNQQYRAELKCYAETLSNNYEVR